MSNSSVQPLISDKVAILEGLEQNDANLECYLYQTINHNVDQSIKEVSWVNQIRSCNLG